jgi:hypothetical protein
MDTEHRAIAELLALTNAPDDALLDQVEAIGERACATCCATKRPGYSIPTC